MLPVVTVTGPLPLASIPRDVDPDVTIVPLFVTETGPLAELASMPEELAPVVVIAPAVTIETGPVVVTAAIPGDAAPTVDKLAPLTVILTLPAP